MNMPGKIRKLLAAALAVLFLAAVSPALASGSWSMVTTEDDLMEMTFRVHEYTGTIRITFLGDCTLGGEERSRGSYRGFVRTIERNGMDWPFRNLVALTASDDLTVANLEGVLSDRDLQRVSKGFNFMGPTSYTAILKAGSVDCVTLANNHSHDYDNAGYADTRKALEEAGVAYFSTDNMVIWRNEEGLMIGFLGVSGSLSGNRAKEYAKQAEFLISSGCAAVITVMHAGQEYVSEPDGYQRQIVDQAIRYSSLIVGHHPHIVQGYVLRGEVPVVYSLGNCVFGGNLNPRDHDAIVLQAELSFTDSLLDGITLHFYPISVSGESNHNDYSPVLLDGADAKRVLKKMENSTGVSPGAFDAAEGAVVRVEITE